MRKDCYQYLFWTGSRDSGSNQSFPSSDIMWDLNNTYLSRFSESVQDAIGITRYQWARGNGLDSVAIGDNAVFLLSPTELQLSQGQAAAIWVTAGPTLAIASTLHIAEYNGSPATQWTRSPKSGNRALVIYAGTDGRAYAGHPNLSPYGCGARPVFTLPDTAWVDSDLLLDESKL